MLRITETFKNKKCATLKLDGKLEGIWISALERIYLQYKQQNDQKVVLDFSGVSFISEDGIEMLGRINNEKIELINCSLFIRSLLSNIL